MAFLDELGLDRLWQNIVAKLNNKIKTEVKVLDDKIKNKLDLKMNKVNPIGEGSFHMNPNEAKKGEFSSTLGFGNKATSHAAHAEGYYTTASGDNSHAEGYYTKASGDNSHAEGNFTTAFGDYSHAEGKDTTASGHVSHAEGCDTIASGSYCHAEGQSTSASGGNSHAEGGNTEASGSHSHAEGSRTIASGANSHAEGYGTTASSGESHAEGSNTIASHWAAHAEGNQTTASGKYSHAEGSDTIASGESQHAQGKYNIEDSTSTYAHIVGNGKNTTIRSNAHTLDWKGNAWYQGEVYVGSTSGKNKDNGSKKLATEEYVTNTLYKDLETQDILDQSIMDKYWWYVPLNAPKIEVYYQESLIKTFNRTSMSTSNGADMWKYGNDEEADAIVFFNTYRGSDCVRRYYDEYGNDVTAEYQEREVKLKEGKGKCFTYMFGYLAYLDEEGNWIRPNDWFPISCAKEGNFAKAMNFALKYSLAISELATEEYVDNAAVQSDWNQNDENIPGYIKNKPFGETPTGGDTLLWDGDTTGKTIVDFNSDGRFLLVKVSESTPPFELMQYGCTIGIMGEKNEVEFSQDQYGQIYIERSPVLFVIPRDATQEEIEQGAIFKEKGVYFLKFGEDFIESLTIPGYTEFPGITKIDEKYLPDYDFAGKRVENKEFEINGETVIANYGAEIFNDYFGNKATGFYSHAEGANTTASGENSHAEGCNTEASGEDSHAEGHYSKTSGAYSHAEGLQTKAHGVASHTEGNSTIAENAYTHVEGSYNLLLNPPIEEQVTENVRFGGGTPLYVCSEQPTIDNDLKQYTASSMEYIDEENIQVGDYITSHAFDYETYYKVTSIDGGRLYGEEHKLIIPSREKGKYAHILGNGTYKNRSNAHTIDWNGNAWFQGNVYVSSTSGIDKDKGSKKLATEEYVDMAITNKITVPQNAVAGDLLTYDGTNWVRISRADLIAEIIAALPRAEEATF